MQYTKLGSTGLDISLICPGCMGFGVFNVIEGLVNRQILGIPHVNETVPEHQWIWWDLDSLPGAW